jgi:hypothetical protein
MRKARRRIVEALLWAWLVMLAFGDWRSSVGVAAAFAALAVWEAARDLKAARRTPKAVDERKPATLPEPGMAPVRPS